ncbi:hypothetical protein HWV62_28050 [Athelia sp. TMB]|nr:hypothetical protein HWV62_28050 [Athelia sp. TMB]
MLLPILTALPFLAATVYGSPTPIIDARAASPTVFMRIEGPTKTIYEKTIVASPKVSLSNSGHTAQCDGPKSAPGVTSLAALEESGQSFQSSNKPQRNPGLQWIGNTFGEITKLGGTSSEGTGKEWGVLINDIGDEGLGGIFLQDSGAVRPSFTLLPAEGCETHTAINCSTAAKSSPTANTFSLRSSVM